MMNERLSVGILEDDMRMRHYLEMVIGDSTEFELAFAASTVSEARQAYRTQTQVPDICLVDIQLPDGLGTDFVRHVKENGHTYALILTILGDKASVIAAFDAGADGYLLKDSSPQQIIDSIKDVASGSNPISAQASSHLIQMLKESRDIDEARQDNILSGRETEVLTLFAKGLSNKEAGQVLNLSPHTIKEHARSIYQKMSVSSRSEAVFEAIKAGWIKT